MWTHHPRYRYNSSCKHAVMATKGINNCLAESCYSGIEPQSHQRSLKPLIHFANWMKSFIFRGNRMRSGWWPWVRQQERKRRNGNVPCLGWSKDKATEKWTVACHTHTHAHTRGTTSSTDEGGEQERKGKEHSQKQTNNVSLCAALFTFCLMPKPT